MPEFIKKRKVRSMEFQKIEKCHQGNYITRYDITYRMADGKEKVYEMISRDAGIQSYEQLTEHPVDAVVLIMEDESGEHILLNREFRLATGKFVYNFPAGLIDEGETPEECARRELKEETGLDLLCVTDTIGESYSAVGFSNEKNLCIVGKAGGTFAPSTSAVEEIEAGWYTKEQIKKLLDSGQPFAARSQAYCYMWCRQLTHQHNSAIV